MAGVLFGRGTLSVSIGLVLTLFFLIPEFVQKPHSTASHSIPDEILGCDVYEQNQPAE